ncbi:MAG: cation diffusion facilitator family transporter [Paludibacteraceae bacterium]
MEEQNAHNHAHSLDHQHSYHGEVKNIKIAFFLNLCFSIIEIAGGFMTNSVAILSDAVHDLGDSLSLGLAWYFQKFSRKHRDKNFTYGYRRFSLVGALVNSIVLIVGSVLILSEAIPRIFHPQPSNATGMFLLAILGIIVNGVAALRLSHGNTLNEKVVSLHLIEDVLGWAAVLIGAVIMHFTHATVIDPILSILIALYVLSNVFRNLKEFFRIILQGTPSKINMDEMVEKIKQIESINSIHDLHLWTIDGNLNILTIHVVLKAEQNMEQLSQLKNQIRAVLNDNGIEHVTIEFETLTEDCTLENCCE